MSKKIQKEISPIELKSYQPRVLSELLSKDINFISDSDLISSTSIKIVKVIKIFVTDDILGVQKLLGHNFESNIRQIFVILGQMKFCKKCQIQRSKIKKTDFEKRQKSKSTCRNFSFS